MKVYCVPMHRFRDVTSLRHRTHSLYAAMTTDNHHPPKQGHRQWRLTGDFGGRIVLQPARHRATNPALAGFSGPNALV
jgi:hypothetical protein